MSSKQRIVAWDTGIRARWYHFIICCYDDIVEAVAWGCRISKLDRIGYPDGHERIRIDPSQVYQGPPPRGEDARSKLLRLRLASRDEG
jgi:hypothetical protein